MLQTSAPAALRLKTPSAKASEPTARPTSLPAHGAGVAAGPAGEFLPACRLACRQRDVHVVGLRCQRHDAGPGKLADDVIAGREIVKRIGAKPVGLRAGFRWLVDPVAVLVEIDGNAGLPRLAG